MHGIDAGSEWTTLLPGFIVAGLAVGLINPVIADVAVSVVPVRESGMAAGINDTFRQVGVALGVAVWGAIFVGRGADKVATLTAGVPGADGHSRALVEAASSGTLDRALANTPPGARERLAAAAHEGFLTGFNDVLLLGGLVALAGAVLALLLVRERDIERSAATAGGLPEPTAA
jgi:hypothetical protein